MKEFSIPNLSFAIVKGKQQIGNISINKRMELKISSNLIKTLSEEDLATLCRRTINSYMLLTRGVTVSENFYYFTVQLGNDQDLIIYYIDGKKNCIGYIKHKNSHLTFEQTVPEYIRIFCCQELKKQNISFNYNGKEYN